MINLGITKNQLLCNDVISLPFPGEPLASHGRHAPEPGRQRPLRSGQRGATQDQRRGTQREEVRTPRGAHCDFPNDSQVTRLDGTLTALRDQFLTVNDKVKEVSVLKDNVRVRQIPKRRSFKKCVMHCRSLYFPGVKTPASFISGHFPFSLPRKREWDFEMSV